MFDGEMKDATGETLVIPVLRGIAAGNISPANLDAAAASASQLYFTSFSGQAAQSNALLSRVTISRRIDVSGSTHCQGRGTLLARGPTGV
jgi:hypothetical protein